MFVSNTLPLYFIQEDSLKSQYTSFGTISNPGQEQTKTFLSFYVAPDMKEALSVVYWTLANSNNVNPPLSVGGGATTFGGKVKACRRRREVWSKNCLFDNAPSTQRHIPS